jgi:C4-dicarboxylate transporter DctM subunit
MLIVGLLVIIGLLVVGTPVWVVIGLPSAIYILVTGVPETLIIQRMFAGMDEFIFIAISAPSPAM